MWSHILRFAPNPGQPNQVQQWKKKLMEGVSEIFQSRTERRESKPYTEDDLMRKIGRLEIENDFLKGFLHQSSAKVVQWGRGSTDFSSSHRSSRSAGKIIIAQTGLERKNAGGKNFYKRLFLPAFDYLQNRLTKERTHLQRYDTNSANSLFSLRQGYDGPTRQSRKQYRQGIRGFALWFPPAGPPVPRYAPE